LDRGGIATVAAPPRVFRVARGERDPFAPPPWDIALADGTFGDRFDDPGGGDLPGAERFRVVYCASTAEAAIGETVARFRPNIAALAGLRALDPDLPYPLPHDLMAARAGMPRGIVPMTRRLDRLLAETAIDPSLLFADLAACRLFGLDVETA
jgi:hypothetical protein